MSKRILSVMIIIFTLIAVVLIGYFLFGQDRVDPSYNSYEKGFTF